MFVVSAIALFSSYVFFFSCVWNDGPLLILTAMMLDAAATFDALQLTGSPSIVLLLW